jgi:hypothetical protein
MDALRATDALIRALHSVGSRDPERDHEQAEQLLLAWLKDIGYTSVAEAYEATKERVGFWYA